MKIKGFSLAELMITVAILGALASYASYNYIKNRQKALRSEGIFRMLSIQSDLERQYAHMGTYISGYTVPDTEHYKYTITTSAQGYSIEANALDFVNNDNVTANPQLKDAEGAVDCSTLTLDNNNTKTPSACWATQ